MRLSVLTLCTILLVFSGLCEAATERLHGVVADESGGVLPGVTVVAIAEDGRVLATNVTDAVGRYRFDTLPMASVRLTFQLEGFSPAVVSLGIPADGEATVPTQRLKLAGTSETVVVRGEARVIAPAPPPRITVPSTGAPPRAEARAGSRQRFHLRPRETQREDGSLRHDSIGSLVEGHGLFVEGDELSIDGGTATGLQVGQNLVARRAYRTSSDRDGTAGEHSAGLVQIVSADHRAAVALVVYACDEMMAGDWLAQFEPQPIRAPEPAGRPAVRSRRADSPD